MKRAGCIFIAVMLMFVFSGCSSRGEDVLYVYNWGEYMSDGTYGEVDNISGFEEYYEEVTGRSIRVYVTSYPSNEDMYAKISTGTSDYDVIFPSDYMIERLIKEDLLRPVELEETCAAYDTECFYDAVTEEYRGLYYDPEDKYSVPYTYGRTGIIYNQTMVDEEDCTGWELLWNAKYAGKILQFNNPRDAFSTAQYMVGSDVNSSDPKDWAEAYELLLSQKNLVQSYVMDEIYNKLESGEAAIGAYYAGDYFTMAEINEDLCFFYPERTNVFVDAMCVPASSQNPEGAALFINYFLSKEPAIANADCIFYSSPDRLVYEDEDYAAEMGEEVMEVLYPEGFNFKEELNKYAFRNLDQDTLLMINDLWEDLKIEGGLPDHIYIIAGVLAAAIVLFIARVLLIKRKRAKWY